MGHCLNGAAVAASATGRPWIVSLPARSGTYREDGRGKLDGFRAFEARHPKSLTSKGNH